MHFRIPKNFLKLNTLDRFVCVTWRWTYTAETWSERSAIKKQNCNISLPVVFLDRGSAGCWAATYTEQQKHRTNPDTHNSCGIRPMIPVFERTDKCRIRLRVRVSLNAKENSTSVHSYKQIVILKAWSELKHENFRILRCKPPQILQWFYLEFKTDKFSHKLDEITRNGQALWRNPSLVKQISQEFYLRSAQHVYITAF
jgi:hypothetical protein